MANNVTLYSETLMSLAEAQPLEGLAELLKRSVKAAEVPIDCLSKDFVRKYMLSDMDYPTDAMKHYQCIRESQGLIDAILNAMIEIQQLELEIELLQKQAEEDSADKAIQQNLCQLDILRKRLQIEGKRKYIQRCQKNLEVYLSVSEEYDPADLSFEDAKCLAMEKKKENLWMLYFNNVLAHRDMTPPELSLFAKNGGVLEPPENIKALLDKYEFEQPRPEMLTSKTEKDLETRLQMAAKQREAEKSLQFENQRELSLPPSMNSLRIV